MSLNLNTTILPPKSPESVVPKPIDPKQIISPKGVAKWKIRYTGDKIDLSPPPKVRKKLEFDGVLDSSLIYRIKRTYDGKRYVGKVYRTDNYNVISRMHTYNYAVNRGGSSMYIVRALALAAEDHLCTFEVKILKVCDGYSEEELTNEEANTQEELKTRGPCGFNISNPRLENKKRSGPRRPKDPLKLKAAVPMKKTYPLRTIVPRTAALAAQSLLKKLSIDF